MNTATNNESQKNMKKGFSPKSKDNHFTDDDTNTESGVQMRSSSDAVSSESSSNKSSERSNEDGGKVRSFREEGGSQSGSQTGSSSSRKGSEEKSPERGRNEGSKTEVSKAGGSEAEGNEKSESKKSGGFVEQLDLALVDASISIGDVVKKIDALAPKEGGIARLSQYTVQKLEGVQNYIGDNGSKEIISSAWQLVRRSPWPIGLALVGAGIGYYIQKATSKTESTKKSDTSEKSAA